MQHPDRHGKINPFLSKNKSRLIYNIVSFCKNRADKHEVINDKLKIVIAASYRNVKNMDGLIEGINLLSEEEKNKLEVNWYGNKNLNSSSENILFGARKKIQKYGLDSIITLNDNINEIEEVYRKSDFVALLSHYEGFPNAICEAMAVGKPVIASRVSDIPIIIKEDENGFLCDSTDYLSIKIAFEKALNAETSKIGEMGHTNRKKAEYLFAKEKILNEYLDLLS